VVALAALHAFCFCLVSGSRLALRLLRVSDRLREVMGTVGHLNALRRRDRSSRTRSNRDRGGEVPAEANFETRIFSMANTRSEHVFERFLAANGIAFRKIPVAETKTPDYAVTIAVPRLSSRSRNWPWIPLGTTMSCMTGRWASGERWAQLS
jgi:hypothetical protein